MQRGMKTIGGEHANRLNWSLSSMLCSGGGGDHNRELCVCREVSRELDRPRGVG